MWNKPRGTSIAVITNIVLSLILLSSVFPPIKSTNTGVAKPMEFYFHYVDEPMSVAGLQTKYVMNTTRSFRFATQQEAYANSVYTSGGGSHENGFRHGITRAVREYLARQNNHFKKVKGITGEDVREGLVAVLSVFVSGNLEFQGQTKERLNSDIQPLVESVVKDGFENHLFHNRTVAEAIIERIVLAAQAREASRQARQSVRRKSGSSRLTLPGKLADCTSNRLEETELFIVEGDSAGGSAKQGRDRRFQAILPLRGKILNVEKARDDKIFGHAEIAAIITVLGTGIDADFEQYAEAIKAYSAFLRNYRRSPNAAGAQFAIAECHEHLGQWVDAMDAYSNYINNFPKGPMVQKAREQINWIKTYRL